MPPLKTGIFGYSATGRSLAQAQSLHHRLLILSASIHEQSLEDVFIHFTGKSIREGEAKKVSLFIGAGVPQR